MLSSFILKVNARERGKTVHVGRGRATSLFLLEVNTCVKYLTASILQAVLLEDDEAARRRGGEPWRGGSSHAKALRGV